MSDPIRIGALCRLTGATPKAVRLYEALGLIPSPTRDEAGYRLYQQEQVDAVGLIRQAQQLGFRLAELQALAQQAPLLEAVSLGLAREGVAKKQAALAAQIQELQALQSRLQDFDGLLSQAHELACACPQLQAKTADKALRKKSA